MLDAVRSDAAPNYYFLHYDLVTWTIKNLLLIPSFAFPPSAIIKRPPLSATARRAGWVGCNFDLTRIPADARIPVVQEGVPLAEAEVRERYRRVKPFQELSVKQRGWTLDVLTAIRNWPKTEFTTQEIYELAPHFEKLHPGNRHVKDKLRQQLQVLRDLGLLENPERGHWRTKNA